MVNARDECYILNPDNLAHPDIFSVLAILGFLSVRPRLTIRRSRTIEIPVLFKVAIRRVPVVLCELAIIYALGEILGLRFRKWAR